MPAQLAPDQIRRILEDEPIRPSDPRPSRDPQTRIQPAAVPTCDQLVPALD